MPFTTQIVFRMRWFACCVLLFRLALHHHSNNSKRSRSCSDDRMASAKQSRTQHRALFCCIRDAVVSAPRPARSSSGSSGAVLASSSSSSHELPPALRLLGPAPPNRPSTVKREPTEREKKQSIYDGLTDAKHLGGSTESDKHGQVPGLWNWLLKAVNVRSVVDVGCGRGISTRWFMDHGADVLCVEGTT